MSGKLEEMMTGSLDVPKPAFRRPMEQVVVGLQSKSDRIRALARAGYSRSEIADFVGVRYQFVRNVLVNDERTARRAPPTQPDTFDSDSRPKPDSLPKEDKSNVVASQASSLEVGVDGEVSVPAGFLRALGIAAGDRVIVAVENDTIRLMSISAAVQRAQAIVRRFVPEGVSLVDALIEDRRADAAREDG